MIEICGILCHCNIIWFLFHTFSFSGSSPFLSMSLPRLHQLFPSAQIFLLFVPLLQWLSLACVLQALLHRLPLPQRLGLLAVSNSLPFPQCFPSASRILTFPHPTPAENIMEESHCPITTVGAFRWGTFYHKSTFSTPSSVPPYLEHEDQGQPPCVVSLSTLDSFSVCPL